MNYMVSKTHSHGCHKTMPHLKTIFKTNYALLKTVFIIIVIPNFQSKHACNKNFKTSAKINMTSVNTTCYQAPQSLRGSKRCCGCGKEVSRAFSSSKTTARRRKKVFWEDAFKKWTDKIGKKKWQNRITQEKLKNLYLHLCQQVRGQEVIRFLKRMLRTKRQSSARAASTLF